MEGEIGNKAKAAKDRAVHLINNSCSVLQLICCNG